jgi:hypothetical protein
MKDGRYSHRILSLRTLVAGLLPEISYFGRLHLDFVINFGFINTGLDLTSSFPFPFVPLQRRGCLVAPLFL